MSKILVSTVSAAAVGLVMAAVSSAGAGSMGQIDAYALTADGKLVAIDTKAMSAGKPMALKGVQGKVLGIDVRPADGMLYAVTSDGGIHTIEPKSGSITRTVALSQPFTGTGAVIVDFNPAADRLRLMSANGVNFRIHPDTGAVTVDGALKYDAADPNAAVQPMIVAGAYTNSVAGTKETALYTIDGKLAQLNLQAPPNDGVQKGKGPLGVPVGTAAFDIKPGPDGANAAWLLAGGTLMRVDLSTGKATAMGKLAGLSGTIVDMAMLPPAATTAASVTPRS